MAEQKHLSVWLCPSENDSQMLFDVISTLAGKFNAPLFAPHITLFSGSLTPEAFETLNFDGSLPFEVKLTRLLQSDSYFQATFCEVENSSVIGSLFDRFSNKVTNSSIEMKLLHLSLIYGHFVKPEQKAIMSAINLKLPTKISINKLSLVKIEGPVHSWKILKSVSL